MSRLPIRVRLTCRSRRGWRCVLAAAVGSSSTCGSAAALLNSDRSALLSRAGPGGERADRARPQPRSTRAQRRRPDRRAARQRGRHRRAVDPATPSAPPILAGKVLGRALRGVHGLAEKAARPSPASTTTAARADSSVPGGRRRARSSSRKSLEPREEALHRLVREFMLGGSAGAPPRDPSPATRWPPATLAAGRGDAPASCRDRRLDARE